MKRDKEKIRSAFARRKMQIIIIVVLIAPLLILLLLVANEKSMRKASGYLMVNDPVKSEVLVVEGWVSERALEEVVQGFQNDGYARILTTGGPLDPQVSLVKTGFYMWRPEEGWKPEEGDSLVLKLRGEVALGILPHFRVEINGQLVGRDSAQVGWEHYAFPLSHIRESIDSICLFFENDGHAYPEDRNLHLAEFSLGDRKFPARASGSAVYVGSKEIHRFQETASLLSWSTACREKLMLLGVPGSQIHAVPAPATIRNRTYTSALVVARYFQDEALTYPGINVFSEGMHARRTWHLYRHAFRGSGMEIGILAESNFEHLSMDLLLLRKVVVKETAGNLYYRFIFNKRKLRKEFLSLDQ